MLDSWLSNTSVFFGDVSHIVYSALSFQKLRTYYEKAHVNLAMTVVYSQCKYRTDDTFATRFHQSVYTCIAVFR
jgi:hypothetical protein